MLPLLFTAALATALLSATLGMAGGLVLMGLYTWLLPVPEAMVLHGLTQLAANAGRAVILRAHIERRGLLGYTVGAVAAAAIARGLALTPPAWAVYLGLGLLPWLVRLVPSTTTPDIRRPATAALAGAVVSGVQSLAGVAGPLLDLFFLNAPLDRRAVVATKSATQVIAHTLKIGVFAGLATLDRTLAVEAAVCLVGATLGTRLGTLVLGRISEAAFKRWTRRTVLAVGAGYLAMGVAALR